MRELLPEDSGALAAARREHMWQRFTRGGAADDRGAELVGVEVLVEHVRRLAQLDGLLEADEDRESASSDHRKERRAFFLARAVIAALENVQSAVGSSKPTDAEDDDAAWMLPRRFFRLFLMRLHQYLAVVNVFLAPFHQPDPTCFGPKTSPTLDPQLTTIALPGFRRLLSELPHTLGLRSSRAAELHGRAKWGLNREPSKLFVLLCAPGSTDISFDRLAKWSLRTQLVKPGCGAPPPSPRAHPASTRCGRCAGPTVTRLCHMHCGLLRARAGALVPQKRWLQHQHENPSDDATCGTYRPSNTPVLPPKRVAPAIDFKSLESPRPPTFRSPNRAPARLPASDIRSFVSRHARPPPRHRKAPEVMSLRHHVIYM
jgi:hypothetical protein